MQKMKSRDYRDELYKILLKKAQGFYYSEETDEFNFEPPKKVIAQNFLTDDMGFFCDDNNNGDNGAQIKSKKTPKKGVIDSSKNQIDDLKLDASGGNDDEISNSENGKIGISENSQGLTLSKKKVTTHYVPPDINAIKILLENYSEKVDDYSLLTTAQLKELAKKLIDDLGLK